eukprot:CAMPEP_0176497070 /NCGR_PEP_ID=MMETSP0200_2-20121128/11525_1 /TAXON_ID=947934 /ORGANISM="Chaetoceros sp., Strain GSL56" /LENGTH=244 /DNA_ID=CAMNT_0017895053 /DNA_START=216 /DNA_END=950 /DNA_ORIENTATION=-
MTFVHSHSEGPGIRAIEGGPNNLKKSTLMFKIHDGRCSRNDDISMISKHDREKELRRTCDCGNSPSSSLTVSCACKSFNDVENGTMEWRVDKVNEIPPYFYIERAHEYIDDLSPSEISKRISDCFNQENESISVVYDDDEAIAFAETNDNTRPEYCKFQVRLYKATDSPSILVECQRRSGCCIKFHSIAMKILCAARGCEYKDDCPHATISKNFLDKCRVESSSTSSIVPPENDELYGGENCHG